MPEEQTLTLSRRLVPERSAVLYFSAVFMAVFAILSCLSFLTILLAENAARERLISSIKIAEGQGVRAMRREAQETLIDVTSEVLTFRSLFQRELASGGVSPETELLLLEFMQNHQTYDQIRFIAADGMERIRVDNEDSGARLLRKDELQDKSQSGYIRKARSITGHQILISQLEPNRERGQIELPLNPVIRVVSRVEGPNREVDGYIVLNYRARFLLGNIESIGNASLGRPKVVSGAGLEALAALDIGTPEALLAAQSAPSFAASYPAVWDLMEREGKGVAADGSGGIMVFERFFPAEARIPDIYATEIRWTLPRDEDPAMEGGFYLVSHVDGAAVTRISRLGLTQSVAVLALFFVIVAGLSWLVALRFSTLRGDSARMHKLATRDDLTDLLTRGEFERRLDEAISHAQRHHRAMALLYIDLDRFKTVNDRLGHLAGDELLKQVGEILSGAVRSSDLVGRMGGDEFAIVLSEVRDRKDTDLVAQKLTQRLSTTLLLAEKPVDISGSVGGATFPDDATTAEGLFECADQAMYENKSQRTAA
jgi:diguanylate cyclase (GGDEF)-like protein